MADVKTLQARIRALGSPEAGAATARFFKTGPGQYSEGDIFLGLRTAVMRSLAKEHQSLPLKQVAKLLRSEFHEERMVALLILVLVATRGGDDVRGEIYELYLSHTKYINNWDLVDASARDIVGVYLAARDREPLHRLAESANLWERRIAIVATHHFIRLGEFNDTLRIAERLFDDREDLIHKATGWMLREVGKKDERTLERFLNRHSQRMPRTTLRYAIERFPPEKRQAYLLGLVEG